jgi:hypothetical protein
MTFYLIAHKVRGEPAFDVAVKMEMPDGPWWIIPTSGHRAYPFAYSQLEYVTKAFVDTASFYDLADVPDHYPLSDYSNRATEPPLRGRPRVPSLEDI